MSDCIAMQQVNPVSQYCNIIMLLTGKGIAGFSRQDMFKQPSGVGVHMTQRVFSLQPCHGLLPGLGMLQNLPSAVVAHVLDPAPGSRVLDMCASPGGGCNLFLNKRTSAHLFCPATGSYVLELVCFSGRRGRSDPEQSYLGQVLHPASG